MMVLHLYKEQQVEHNFHLMISIEVNRSLQKQVNNKFKDNFSYLFHLEIPDDNEEIKSKISIPTIYRQTSISSLNHLENDTLRQKRPTTAIVRNQASVHISSRLNSAKISSDSLKKKSTLVNRIDSASNLPKQHHRTIGSETSTYSQTLYAGRPFSAVAPKQHRSNDSPCSIREAKGTASRYNKPEELFGLRPEELFAPEEHQPKILDQRTKNKTDENTRLKRNHLQKQQHFWQQDVDQIIELYNIHHTTNYRTTAVPPASIPLVIQTDTITDLPHGGRARRGSISKNVGTLLKPPINPKQSTLASLNLPRRNSITRPSIKLTNT
jgi:hypothetical protein